MGKWHILSGRLQVGAGAGQSSDLADGCGQEREEELQTQVECGLREQGRPGQVAGHKDRKPALKSEQGHGQGEAVEGQGTTPIPMVGTIQEA